MTRSLAAAGLIGLALATSRCEAQDEPPPLTGPAGALPTVAPSPVAPAPPQPKITRVKPNLLRPRSPIQSRPTVAPRVDSTEPSLDSLPLLDGPIEMKPDALGEIRSTPRDEGPPPLTLEPAGPDDLENLTKPRTSPLPEKSSSRSAPAARPPRKPGLLGLLPGRNRVAPTATVTVEPRSDPAADDSLKRKIETKVFDAVGPQTREIEVRVVGRNVLVRVKTLRFWNRRAVRKTIESLPILAGFNSRVEIVD